jgi:23S rRNA (uracil1939-C5)-methyltransferase
MSEIFHKGMELELDIEKMAFGGRGLGRHEGAVVFVDRALPGQRVRAKVTKAAKRFAEADCVEVVEQTPHFTTPFCRHFGKCGGCMFQDLDYGEQLRWKAEHVRDQLARIGRVADPLVHPAAASPEVRGFRNKMEFAFAGGGETMLGLGLHRRGSESVVSIEECHLQSAEAVEIMRETREFCRRVGIPAWDPRTGKGLWRFLVVRESKTNLRTMAQIITAPRPDGGAVRSLADHLHERFASLASVVHSTRKARPAIAQGERTVFATGEGCIEETVGGLRYRISADSFFQTNTAAAGKLYAAAREACALTGAERVVDLYCGSGGLSLTVAGDAASVVGVETVAAAVKDAEANAKLNGIDNCEFVAGDVLRTLGAMAEDGSAAVDVALVDPPRSGMHPEAVAALTKLAPKRIVYVSCNPATLARDVQLLGDAYRLVEARPFDLFPHGPHIECVATLVAAKA